MGVCILPRERADFSSPNSDLAALYRVAYDERAELSARVEAARDLGERAFVTRDARAWDVAHYLTWRVQRRGRLCPTLPGDVAVIAALYDAEERAIEPAKVPSHLEGDAYWDALDAELASMRAEYKSDLALLDDLDLAEWRAVLNCFIPSVWDFVRYVALLSLRLPHELACLTFENLYDEAGGGDPTKMHRRTFIALLRDLEMTLPDLDAARPDLGFLDDVVPEILAEVNCYTRALRHSSPGAGLGALYVVECGVPWYYEPIAAALRARGIQSDAANYLSSHVEGDKEHASAWRDMLRHLQGPRRDDAYRAALESVGWEVITWRKMAEMIRQRRAGVRVDTLSTVRSALE